MKREEELLVGAIDMHVHPTLDVIEPRLNAVEFARDCLSRQMAGAVIKCIYTQTADLAFLINEIVPEFKTFGGITLNDHVGGINRSAVAASIAFHGKVVWMPTQSAANHIRHFGIPKGPTTYFRPSLDLPMKEGGISILTENGELKGETKEVLNLIAEHRQILATAHLSVGEILVLVDEAKRVGVEKIVITHPEFEAVNMPIDTQKKLADKGAYLEYNFVNCTPIVRYPINPDTWAKAIKEVGAENCVMATDLGQPANPPPSEGLRSFIRLMLDRGITKEEIRLMVNENPRKLLDVT